MPAKVELILLMVAVASACAVPGVFLVLRRVALVSDAISHVLLFGIVMAYLFIPDINSPWLLVGAASSGVLTVALVEALQRTRLLKEDAAIGLVFPALFSIGALLLGINVAKDTHLDVHQVLLGYAEYATQTRAIWWGYDLGPLGLVVMAGLFLLNVALVAVFYKELKLSTFDPGMATTLGFAPAVLHYGLMTAVSITAVAAFDSVGPVVVVAMFVVPPSAAYLLTDRLGWMLVIAIALSTLGAVAGVLLALAFDATIGGTVATTTGALFGLVFVFAPRRGWVSQLVRRWGQKRRFHETMLAIHLLQHEGTPQEMEESRWDGLHRHLRWLPKEVSAVVNRSERNGWVVRDAGRLRLTDTGRRLAHTALGGSPTTS
jgi:manganese/zinc/iron transport system permease protein